MLPKLPYSKDNDYTKEQANVRRKVVEDEKLLISFVNYHKKRISLESLSGYQFVVRVFVICVPRENPSKAFTSRPPLLRGKYCVKDILILLVCY